MRGQVQGMLEHVPFALLCDRIFAAEAMNADKRWWMRLRVGHSLGALWVVYNRSDAEAVIEHYTKGMGKPAPHELWVCNQEGREVGPFRFIDRKWTRCKRRKGRAA